MTSKNYNDSDWEIPTHEVALYSEKRERHALVIPVINEGARIRGQLLRTMAANLPVDVVVADGGSTDGSLDADFVSGAGVRAVLTKTGPGKLSSQLRMAYAWCLQEGYEGIVTIDGNGKDGVGAVADMVAKLEEGCDYVQGSRYLRGGEAENTPLERTIANRLIHAPMLSLAGKHWFTDTTNGFRAYSARYLTHPQVKPFRDEFQVYGLLFYLTVRAGQLGLKVDHVPVQRRYPDTGNVPTKIGGFESKLALLGETVFAATGGHTPDDAERKPAPLFWASLMAALVVLPLLLGVLVTPPYTPDSWALYELSRTVFADFYRFAHFRSYADASPYSAAFPPLFPVLIAVVDGVFGTGARTGLYVAFASFIVFATVSEAIGRRVTGAAWVGLAAALLLLLGPKMLLVELEAGRTIPLQLCLYALVLLALLSRGSITGLRAFGIGVVAGLAVLNRFDAILLPLFSAIALAWVTQKPIRAVQALLGSLIAVSPWIYYSLTTFGTLFATDNSGIIASVDPRAFVTDWWPQPQPNIADNPAGWLNKVVGNLGGFVAIGAALIASLMGLGFVAMLAIIGALQQLVGRGSSAAAKARHEVGPLLILAGSSLILAVMMGPQVLTGYLEYRYYTALFWAFFLLALSWTVLRGVNQAQRAVFARIMIVTALAITLPFSAVTLAQASVTGKVSHDRWSQFDISAEMEQLQACFSDHSASRVLVIGDDNFAARAGALAGFKTMMEPRNMAQGRLDRDGARAFVNQWGVQHVLLMDTGRESFVTETFEGKLVPGCALNLYEVAQEDA